MTIPLQADSKLIFSSMHGFDERMEDYIWSLDGGLWGMLQDAGLALGAVFSLVIVARIAYRAMLLEEGIDILAILRPVLVAFVLANWYWVTTCLHSLTEPIEDGMKYMYEYQANELGRLRDKRSAASLDVMGKMRVEAAKAEVMTRTEESVEQQNTADKDIDDGEDDVSNTLAEKFGDMYYPNEIELATSGLMITNSYSSQFWEWLVMWIGEITWEVSCYFIFLIKNIYLAVLVFFGPITIACCILPVWKDEWATWIGRMVSVSLYGAMAYLIMTIAMKLIEFGLLTDISTLEQAGREESVLYSFIKYKSDLWGTLSLYLIALFAGSAALYMVPSVASWAIPSSVARSVNSFVGGGLKVYKESIKLAASVTVAAVTAGTGAAAGAAGGSAVAGGGATATAGSTGTAGASAGQTTASTGAGGTTGRGKEPFSTEKPEKAMDDFKEVKKKVSGNGEDRKGNDREEDKPTWFKEDEEKERRREKLKKDLEEYEKAMEEGYLDVYMIEKGYDTGSYRNISEELEKMEKELESKKRKRKK